MPALASRSGASQRRRTINEINMVPFIDVMLVLLIIFMVAAPLIAPSVIDLPSVGKAQAQPDAVIQISIKKDEKLEIKSSKSKAEPAGAALESIADQVQQLQAGNRKTPVVISADKSVKYETVVAVMDKLQRAGVERVGLAVNIAR